MEIEDYTTEKSSSDNLVDDEGNDIFKLPDISIDPFRKNESENEGASIKIAEEQSTHSSIIEIGAAQDSSNYWNS